MTWTQALTSLQQSIWRDQQSGISFDELLGRLGEFEIQLIVQKRLRETVDFLQQHASSKVLPDQRHARVSQFLRFINGDHERAVRFRHLNHYSLKICGLSYKIKEIKEMPEVRIAFLINHVDDFTTRCPNLGKYLCRRDIDHSLLKNNLDEYHSKLSMPIPYFEPDSKEKEAVPPLMPQDGDKEIAREQVPLYQTEKRLPTQDKRGDDKKIQWFFTNGPAHHISKFSEPIQAAIRNGQQWKLERKTGLQTTSCWCLSFPDKNHDVSLTIWCGEKEAIRLCEELEVTGVGFGGDIFDVGHLKYTLANRT